MYKGICEKCQEEEAETEKESALREDADEARREFRREERESGMVKEPSND
jgi:hypothetical protein